MLLAHSLINLSSVMIKFNYEYFKHFSHNNFRNVHFIFIVFMLCYFSLGFHGDSEVKNLPFNAGDASSIPELGRSPRGENGNPLQYSCLEHPMDRGAWQATVPGVAKSQT